MSQRRLRGTRLTGSGTSVFPSGLASCRSSAIATSGCEAEVDGDETVTFYRSLDEFWAEAEDGDEDHRTVTILRETGRPFELAGAR